MLWWCLLLVSWGSTAAESSLEQASLSCKPASNVFDAVKDNARIIDTFFKNQEIIAEGVLLNGPSTPSLSRACQARQPPTLPILRDPKKSQLKAKHGKECP